MKRWRLERSDRAHEDLLDIWAYVASDNREAADQLIRDLSALFEKTADYPELGRAADWLVPGHRILARGNYLLIYQPDAHRRVVKLVRVVHGARNWPNLFGH